jgi:hypothetical protein
MVSSIIPQDVSQDISELLKLLLVFGMAAKPFLFKGKGENFNGSQDKNIS